MGKIRGFIGTYTSPDSRGLYEFFLDTDTGGVGGLKLFYRADDAKCADLAGGYLAAPAARDGKAGLLLLDTERPGDPFSDAVWHEERTACFVTHGEESGGENGRESAAACFYAANYHEGHVLVYENRRGRLVEKKRVLAAPGAGCHQVLFHGSLMLVPCLELDEIRIFDRDRDFAPAGKITFPPGSGPRHGVFNREHTRLYVVGERSCLLYVFSVEREPGDGPAAKGHRADGHGPGSPGEGHGGELFCLTGTAPLLPEKREKSGEEAAAAAIRLSPDQRFVYVSVRGADLLTVLKIGEREAFPVQHADCGGKHPRDFVLSPDGRFLLSVNRFSGGLVSMERDAATGLLGRICGRADVRNAVGIALEREKR